MIEWAEHEFRLGRKMDDGATQADHVALADKIIANLPGWKGKKPSAEVSAGPPFPEPLDYLWGWFAEFSIGLKADGMGPVMASWVDVEAWCGVMRMDMEPWEKRALVHIANVRANVNAEQQAAKMKQKRS